MQQCTAFWQKQRYIKLLYHSVILFGLRKGKTDNFSLELYLIFYSIYSVQGTEKLFLLLFLTVVGGRVGYQGWHEFCCVWLDLVCQECLGQSGIWTSFDGELWATCLTDQLWQLLSMKVWLVSLAVTAVTVAIYESLWLIFPRWCTPGK